MKKELNVYIAGKQAGVLFQDGSGSLSFSYLKDYRGAPLSSAMPLSTGVYRDKTVAPYLWGLLPEDPNARKSVALQAGISPNNPFALLSVMGLDCPGAVQFCSADGETLRDEQLLPLTDAEIAERLSLGRTGENGWLAHNEHWSLGGQQNKFALREIDGHWYSCQGAAATTHIFKSGVHGLSHQALNEYICMRLAAACGIPTAHVEYCEFEGVGGIEPAIIVERYDRVSIDDQVFRLHQEDFCQALGCMPDNKYTMYGGPGGNDILKRLASSGSFAQKNTAQFLQMLFFNYLIAATDAHAKKYSYLLNEEGNHRLAPFYDVASIVPYTRAEQFNVKPPKLAMSIGGENRVGFLTLQNLENLVGASHLEQWGITSRGCADLVCLYADLIPEKLASIFDDLKQTRVASSSEELRMHMEKPIADLCACSKARLAN